MVRRNTCHRGDPQGKVLIQCGGALMLLLGVALAVTTEYAYLDRSRALREAMAHTEPVALHELEQYYRAHPPLSSRSTRDGGGGEGGGDARLVHTSGHLQSAWLATDTALGVGVRAVRLRRTVWMYQRWRESRSGANSGSRTVVGWRETPHSDGALRSVANTVTSAVTGSSGADAYSNPPMLLQTTTFTARDTRLGAFDVDPQLLEHITWWQPLPCTPAVAQLIARAVSDAASKGDGRPHPLVSDDVVALVAARGIRADDSTGYCVLSHDPATVQIGDYRIRLEYAVPTGVRAPLFARADAVTPSTPAQRAAVELPLPETKDFWWRTVTATDDRHAVSVLALAAPYDAADRSDHDGDGQPDALPVRLAPYHAASSHGVVSFLVSHGDGNEWHSSAAGMFTGALRSNRWRTFGGRVVAFALLWGHGWVCAVDYHALSAAPWAPHVWHVVRAAHCTLDGLATAGALSPWAAPLLLATTAHCLAAAAAWLLCGWDVAYAALCACAAVLPWLLHRHLAPASYDRLKDG